MDVINTLIIPTIRVDYIDRCIETFKKYTPENYRIIVVDQSVNGVSEYARQNAHLYVRSYKALGFSKACNTGIRLADTQYITVCNDDTEFMHATWWDELVKEFTEKPDVCAVNPMSPKEPGWGYGYPTHYDHEYIELLPYKPEYTEEEYQFLLKGDFSSVSPLPSTFPKQMSGVVDGIATWCTVFRSDILKGELGLYDEHFYPGGGEDYDLCGRAYCPIWGTQRWRMIGTMKSWVYHHWSRTKDYLGDLPQLDSSKNWNDLNALWNNDYDLWGFTKKVDENGNRVPCQRIPEVYVDPL